MNQVFIKDTGRLTGNKIMWCFSVAIARSIWHGNLVLMGHILCPTGVADGGKEALNVNGGKHLMLKTCCKTQWGMLGANEIYKET